MSQVVNILHLRQAQRAIQIWAGGRGHPPRDGL